MRGGAAGCPGAAEIGLRGGPELYRNGAAAQRGARQENSGHDVPEIHERGAQRGLCRIYTRMEEHGEEATPRLQKLLPLSADAFRPGEGKPQKPQQVNYLPNAGAVLGSIAPNYVTGYLFGALVEAFCSEENARMLAMKSATDSAADMLRELSVIYNSVRQAAITQQIVEVAGGAKAQKRKKTS